MITIFSSFAQSKTVPKILRLTANFHYRDFQNIFAIHFLPIARCILYMSLKLHDHILLFNEIMTNLIRKYVHRNICNCCRENTSYVKNSKATTF